MRPLLELAVPPVRRYRYWSQAGWWGDQGATSMCVGYSLAAWIEDGPVTHPGIAPIVRPRPIYDLARTMDEWPGVDYDGTSVRAGMKALRSMGWVDSFRWALSMEEVVETLLTGGPVVVGTNWYEAMFDPDPDGTVHIGGDVVGGHAYKLDGVSLDDRRVRGKNSWGRGWGSRGALWMSFDDLERLIDEQGEACFGVERLRQATV